MFTHLEHYPGDPIFRIGDMCRQDPRPEKVDLAVGLYFDEDGKIPLLKSVHEAEKQLCEQQIIRPYLPIEGLQSYRQAIQHLLFGQDSSAIKEQRIATVQSLGGSGALSLGAALLHHAYPKSEVWISNPGWDNHHAIFEAAGIKTHTYPYYQAQSGGLQFEAMMDCLRTLPAQSIVLFQPCCHNPTGADLSLSQWNEVIDLVIHNDLIPFLDTAYQGFGDGLIEDTQVIRAFEKHHVPVLVANSFSKNFSLYAERCGGLSVLCQSIDEAERVLGQLKMIIRRTYSNPSLHGALTVSTILNTPTLHQQWHQEIDSMRTRIQAMRQKAYEVLFDKAPQFDSTALIKQKGMFSYLSLSLSQIERLRSEFAIYMLDSGRINVPGLNEHNVVYFAESLAKVV